MDSEQKSGLCKALAYFGMSTPGEASQTILWILPYIGLLIIALGGLSYLVYLIEPLPVTGFVAAVAFAAVYFFFFLARMRTSKINHALECEVPANDAPVDEE